MKHSPDHFLKMKNNAPIPMLTAYTAAAAKCLEEAGIPVLLVGDTVGMVEMGFPSTRFVTLDHMVYHVGAVRRGAPDTHIIGDLPYKQDETPDLALAASLRLLEAGADSVKLEGPKVEVIRHLVKNGVAVVGHTGLTPQTAQNFRQVGREAKDAERIFEEAREIESAGCFMIVLEHIPVDLGKKISQSLKIPTIGIGAGPHCDGQVLVINDLLGMGTKWPPFSRQYAYVHKVIVEAASAFRNDVEKGIFK